MRTTIRTVCAKEMRDALRDPRAVLYLIGLPLLFYPSLLLVLEVLAHRLVAAPAELPYRVQITNVEGAPAITHALFTSPDLFVVTVTSPVVGVACGEAQVGVEPMEGFEGVLAGGHSPRLDLYVNRSVPGADRAAARVRAIIDQATAGGGSPVPPPDAAAVTVVETGIGSPPGDFSFMVGLFPYFLIVLILVGAAHMAIDVTAGEKERRTLETLLVTPAGRLSLLFGKALATMLAALVSGVLGMIGFALATRLAVPLTDGHPILLALPGNAFWILGLASIPTAAFFSTLLLTLGTLARSAREGQTYAAYLQMPLLLLGLAATWIHPADAPWVYTIPLLGMNLMQKEFLYGQGEVPHAIVASGATLLLSALLILIASRLFSSERVLFRA